MVNLVLTHSSLKTGTITNRPLLGRSNHIVLEMDYIVKEEVLEYIKLAQDRSMNKETMKQTRTLRRHIEKPNSKPGV